MRARKVAVRITDVATVCMRRDGELPGGVGARIIGYLNMRPDKCRTLGRVDNLRWEAYIACMFGYDVWVRVVGMIPLVKYLCGVVHMGI